MNKWILLAIVLFIGMVFLFTYETLYPNPINLSKRIMRQHVQQMKSSGYEIDMIGGSFLDGVNELAIGFQSNDTPTVDEARLTYVHAVELFLDRVNSNEAIKPFLHTTPFKIDNVDYTLSFKWCNTNLEKVSYMFFSRGDLVYFSLEPDGKDGYNLITIYREPYAEALRIVREAGLLETAPAK